MTVLGSLLALRWTILGWIDIAFFGLCRSYHENWSELICLGRKYGMFHLFLLMLTITILVWWFFQLIFLLIHIDFWNCRNLFHNSWLAESSPWNLLCFTCSSEYSGHLVKESLSSHYCSALILVVVLSFHFWLVILLYLLQKPKSRSFTVVWSNLSFLEELIRKFEFHMATFPCWL